MHLPYLELSRVPRSFRHMVFSAWLLLLCLACAGAGIGVDLVSSAPVHHQSVSESGSSSDWLTMEDSIRAVATTGAALTSSNYDDEAALDHFPLTCGKRHRRDGSPNVSPAATASQLVFLDPEFSSDEEFLDGGSNAAKRAKLRRFDSFSSEEAVNNYTPPSSIDSCDDAFCSEQPERSSSRISCEPSCPSAECFIKHSAKDQTVAAATASSAETVLSQFDCPSFQHVDSIETVPYSQKGRCSSLGSFGSSRTPGNSLKPTAQLLHPQATGRPVAPLLFSSIASECQRKQVETSGIDSISRAFVFSDEDEDKDEKDFIDKSKTFLPIESDDDDDPELCEIFENFGKVVIR